MQLKVIKQLAPVYHTLTETGEEVGPAPVVAEVEDRHCDGYTIVYPHNMPQVKRLRKGRKDGKR